MQPAALLNRLTGSLGAGTLGPLAFTDPAPHPDAATSAPAAGRGPASDPGGLPLPPGTMGLPLFGETLEFLKDRKKFVAVR